MSGGLQLIKWDKSLETGIAVIDEQHREFMERANHFFLSFMVEQKTEAVLQELDFLEKYLYHHFHTEEVFQRESSYPEFASHQEEHRSLTAKVKEVKAMILEMNEENSIECYEQFVDLVNQWIGDHILDSDIKFSHYYTTMLE